MRDGNLRPGAARTKGGICQKKAHTIWNLFVQTADINLGVILTRAERLREMEGRAIIVEVLITEVFFIIVLCVFCRLRV